MSAAGRTAAFCQQTNSPKNSSISIISTVWSQSRLPWIYQPNEHLILEAAPQWPVKLSRLKPQTLNSKTDFKGPSKDLPLHPLCSSIFPVYWGIIYQLIDLLHSWCNKICVMVGNSLWISLNFLCWLFAPLFEELFNNVFLNTLMYFSNLLRAIKPTYGAIASNLMWKYQQWDGHK